MNPEDKLQSLAGYLNCRGVDVYEVAGNARFTARANGRHSFGLPRNPTGLVEKAESFLRTKKIDFAHPAKIGRVATDKSEVIFWIPEALEPDPVTDPPDVRIWVFHEEKKVELVFPIP